MREYLKNYYKYICKYMLGLYVSLKNSEFRNRVEEKLKVYGGINAIKCVRYFFPSFLSNNNVRLIFVTTFLAEGFV